MHNSSPFPISFGPLAHPLPPASHFGGTMRQTLEIPRLLSWRRIFGEMAAFSTAS